MLMHLYAAAALMERASQISIMYPLSSGCLQATSMSALFIRSESSSLPERGQRRLAMSYGIKHSLIAIKPWSIKQISSSCYWFSRSLKQLLFFRFSLDYFDDCSAQLVSAQHWAHNWNPITGILAVLVANFIVPNWVGVGGSKGSTKNEMSRGNVWNAEPMLRAISLVTRIYRPPCPWCWLWRWHWSAGPPLQHSPLGQQQSEASSHPTIKHEASRRVINKLPSV